MSSTKNKIFSIYKKAKHSLDIFLFSKSAGRLKQVDIDKKLVYSLSPRKIPSRKQFKYLGRFLNPRENVILKICLILILASLVYVGFQAFTKYFVSAPEGGGSYAEALVGYPKSLNPLYSSSRDVDNDLSRLLYSSLYEYNAFQELKADLVESYEVSDEGKVYEIKLKPGVLFHDGFSLSADDVVFTFNLIKDSAYNSPLRPEFSGIEIEKLNDLSIKFILSEPYAPFLDLLTFNIMPEHIWQNTDPSEISISEYNLKPIGSGPYQFKTLLKSKNGDIKEYELERNENYYNLKPYIENINLLFYNSIEEAIANFNDNRVDALSLPSQAYSNQLFSSESVKAFDLLRPQLVGLFFNLDIETLQNLEMRQSLSQAIDKQELVSDVYQGGYEVAYGPILKHSFAYQKEIEEKNQYNFEAAKEFLKDKGINLKLTVIDINGNIAVAEKIKEDWEAVGVGVQINIIPMQEALNTIQKEDFEVLLYGQSIGGDPDVYAFWHSSQSAPNGLNISSYENEEVDKLLSQARVTTNKDERIKKYQDFQNILASDVPVIYLYSPAFTYVHNKRVKGFVGEAIVRPADRFAQISQWYIKTKKVRNK